MGSMASLYQQTDKVLFIHPLISNAKKCIAYIFATFSMSNKLYEYTLAIFDLYSLFKVLDPLLSQRI